MCGCPSAFGRRVPCCTHAPLPLLPIVGLAVSYAGLMFTSNLVIVLFTPLLAGYVLVLTIVYAIPEEVDRSTVSWPRRFGFWLRRCVPPLCGGLLGLGLSAVFWLPMVFERQFVRVDQWFAGRYDFRGHFVYPHQLFSPTWGFGVSTVGPDDPISFQIGVVALCFAVLGVLFAWSPRGAYVGRSAIMSSLPLAPRCWPCGALLPSGNCR